MAELFDRDVKTIGKHISNALKEELDNSTVAKFATVQNEGSREVERYIEITNMQEVHFQCLKTMVEGASVKQSKNTIVMKVSDRETSEVDLPLCFLFEDCIP